MVRVGVTSAAPGSVPTAGQYDPPDANIAAIYRWIDNVELPTTSAAVTDPELHGNGYTPLGRSLFYARMYYENLVKPTDPKGSCRQNVVILVTDGAETCDETTAPNNTFVTTSTMTPPTDLCTGGGNYNPFHPVAQACLLQKAGIKVYVITDTDHRRRERHDRGRGRHRHGGPRHADRRQRGEDGDRRHHRVDRAAGRGVQRRRRQLQRPDRRGRVERLRCARPATPSPPVPAS